MKKLDYGKDYAYAHDFENNFTDLEYLPQNISGTTFYKPGKNAREQQIQTWLRERWREKYDY